MLKRISAHPLLSVFLVAVALAFGATTGTVFGKAVVQALLPEKSWAEISREQPLQPCFPNSAFTWLHNEGKKANLELSEEELAELKGQGRIIPASYEKGNIIPKDCFAVGSGLYGFNVTYWKRPMMTNQNPDMSIPYWNPTHDQDAFHAIREAKAE